MKPLRSILTAIALLFAAGVYVYMQEYGGDGSGGRVEPPPQAQPSKPANTNTAATGNFDYYVLSLSWSPSFCRTDATDRDRMQCGGKPFGFIVHGLWPQNEKGYPENCPTDDPRVPDALINTLLDIMPSRGLIGHEWRSHGACTGMEQDAYFAQVRAAYEAVAIPQAFDAPPSALSLSPKEIARAFIEANAGKLEGGDLVVTCHGELLDEIRLCLTKDLRFRACGNQMKGATCRRDSVTVPPIGH